MAINTSLWKKPKDAFTKDEQDLAQEVWNEITAGQPVRVLINSNNGVPTFFKGSFMQKNRIPTSACRYLIEKGIAHVVGERLELIDGKTPDKEYVVPGKTEKITVSRSGPVHTLSKEQAKMIGIMNKLPPAQQEKCHAAISKVVDDYIKELTC